MPKITVSLPQRARLRGVCVACALGDATSFILNMIVRPRGSQREAIDG